MKADSFRAVAAALQEADVRFLVAGGLAVNIYGYLRYTKDVDLVVELDPENVRAVFRALKTLGYRPTVPITAEHLGDRALREKLIAEKGMKVLQFFSDRHRETPIDVFVTHEFEFNDEYERATVRDFPGLGSVRFVSLTTLIAMKEAAGRQEDLIDLEHLRMIRDDD